MQIIHFVTSINGSWRMLSRTNVTYQRQWRLKTNFQRQESDDFIQACQHSMSSFRIASPVVFSIWSHISTACNEQRNHSLWLSMNIHWFPQTYFPNISKQITFRTVALQVRQQTEHLVCKKIDIVVFLVTFGYPAYSILGGEPER